MKRQPNLVVHFLCSSSLLAGSAAVVTTGIGGLFGGSTEVSFQALNLSESNDSYNTRLLKVASATAVGATVARVTGPLSSVIQLPVL